MLYLSIDATKVSIPYRHIKNHGWGGSLRAYKNIVSIPYRHIKNSAGYSVLSVMVSVSIPYRHIKNMQEFRDYMKEMLFQSPIGT